MKVPLNWLKEFVKLPKETSELTDRLTMVGHMLDKKEIVNGEMVLDLELRGNRADCYSIMGIAREVSALYKTPIKPPKELSKIKIVKAISGVNLNIKTPLVKRVMMTKIKDVKIIESPKWLADRVKAYGIDPINNIVDLTNYVMIETGEPMHSFDSDKLGENLEIRMAINNENITTFNDDVISLTSDDMVWSNGTEILSVAGAIGGKYHSIMADTKNVLLEAASYDRANIRRTVHRHNLLTDAGIRHEKQLDPNLVQTAISRYLYLVKENGWGKIDEGVSDYYPKAVKPWKIKVGLEKVKNLGGIDISSAEIKGILASLNFDITSANKNYLEVVIPTYRTDVVIEEDVIEEILRIYGYEKIPINTLSLEIPPVITPEFINQELKLKSDVAGLGLNEIISSTFVKEDLLNLNTLVGEGVAQPVSLSNPPSPDNKFLRMALLPNLYEFTQKIINERGLSASLFEIGKVYYKEKERYVEKRKLGIAGRNKNGLKFADFKGIIDAIFIRSNIVDVSFSSTPLSSPLGETFSISVGKEIAGHGGKYQGVYFCEIDLDSILGKAREDNITLWPKYPPQIEDHNFTFPEKTKIGDVLNAIKNTDSNVSDLQIVDVFKDTYTIRIWYQNQHKTLTDSEVEQIRNKILFKVKEKFGGQIKN